MDDFWYVLYVKPRSEKKTTDALLALGLQVYAPTQRLLRQWKDRKKWVEMPLFNGYIFIKIAEKERNSVFQHKNVLKYVRIGSEYAQVSDSEMERIRAISRSLTEVVIIEKTQKNALLGKRVRVINGLLTGMEGEIVAENNQTVLRIAIAGLGCLMQVEMSSADVEVYV
jgi:transcription antitermination factor NusG